MRALQVKGDQVCGFFAGPKLVTYNIDVTKGGKTHVVQKRFSDFTAFRRVLSVESPELMMVPFPNSTSTFSKTSKKSHNARMGKLDEFARAIVEQRWSRFSKKQKQLVQAFLKAPTSKQRTGQFAKQPAQSDQQEQQVAKQCDTSVEESKLPVMLSPTQIKISRTEQLTEDSPAGKSEM
jgi:hypothetical protein